MRRERVERDDVWMGRCETRPKEDAPVARISLLQIMAPSTSKKRKRDDEGEDGRISLKLSAPPENQIGPVLGEPLTPRLVIGGGG